MQNLEKIEPRISSVDICPVISPRWCRVSRMSCAMKSPEIPAVSASIARAMESVAWVSAW